MSTDAHGDDVEPCDRCNTDLFVTHSKGRGGFTCTACGAEWGAPDRDPATEPETVYRLPGKSANGTYHYRRNCQHIKAGERAPLEWTIEIARRSSKTPCETCAQVDRE